MSGGCATVATDPAALVSSSISTSSQPISSSVSTAQMPSIDLSSMAMYPTVIGWAVLYGIIGLLVLFLGSYLAGINYIINWWSTFVWSSLAILLIMLATINGSYNSMLSKMHMCENALNSFIKVAMVTLAAITIGIWYVINNDFGTNRNTNTYLLVMLHVNLLCSLLNLCLVTMQKLSGTGISKS